jgi:electron transport complex protein RnfG
MMDRSATRQGYLQSAWLILVLALAYGAGLAGVQTSLAPRVQANKRQETYEVIPDLVPGADKEKTVELLVQLDDGQQKRVYRTHDAAGTPNGWVVPAAGPGFADRIELLIGTDSRIDTLIGLYVLDQKETPGLGDYIAQTEFRHRFRERPLDQPLEAVKYDPQLPHEIEAISGATVSSWSVCSMVNDTIRRWREPILSAAAKQNAKAED